MTILKERLSEAIESKKNDINSFVWKGKRVFVDGKRVQEEKRLVDCTQEELQRNYDYCKQMLYNTDRATPGRYPLLKIIKDQIARCNCELFLRHLKEEHHKDRFNFISELKNVIGVNKQNLNFEEVPVSLMASNIPAEFAEIPVSMVIEAGSDRLGYFDKKHITLNFIIRQGLWFTPEELKQFTVKDDKGNLINRVELVKKELNIPSNFTIKITPKGLSFHELKAMIDLKSQKYINLTDEQLRVLRNRILFALNDDCCFHIKQWETLIDQIMKVAEHKKYTLNE